MQSVILVGRGREVIKTSESEWAADISGSSKYFEKKLSFMTDVHRRVRNFVVTELPKTGKPLAPKYISQMLHIPVDHIQSILSDLEQGMIFLYRNQQGLVEWAYPVTTAKTPHYASFSSGERLNAA